MFAYVKRRPLLPIVPAAAWCLVAIVPWRIWVSHHGIRSSTPLGKAIDPGYLSARSTGSGRR